MATSATPIIGAEVLTILTWALLALAAVVVGLVFALLTYARTEGDWPTTLIAGLSAAGAFVVAFHQLVIH